MTEPLPLQNAEDVTAYLRRIWQGQAVGLVYDGHLHHVRVGTAYGERYGRDGVVADTVQELAALPDLRFRAEGTVWTEGAVRAEGRGLYVSHLALRAAHNTGFSRYGPPTGRRVRYLAATDLLLRNGRVAEMWRVHDGLGLTRQLGLSDEAAVRAVTAQPTVSPTSPSLHGSGALEPYGQEPSESLPRPSPGEGPEALVGWLWHEVWNRRRLDRVGEFYAPDYRFHGPSGVRLRTRTGFSTYVLGLLAAFPDAVMRLEHVCRTDKHVAVRWRLLGTHGGPGRYGSPTGKRVNVLGVTHHRLRGEQLTGERTVFDELALLAQLNDPHSEDTKPDLKPDNLKPDDPTTARQGEPSVFLEE